MKKGFFLSFILIILFFTSVIIGFTIKLSLQYISSVTYYKQLIFYHYIAKSILKMWRDNHFRDVLKSWIIIDNKKICYVFIINNKIYLMDDEEPKGKIMYYYEEN